MEAGLFDVEVHTLSLGLTLGANNTVASLDPRGEAALSVLLGDVLLAVDGRRVPRGDVAAVNSMLQNAPRPTVLQFISRECTSEIELQHGATPAKEAGGMPRQALPWRVACRGAWSTSSTLSSTA